MTQATVLWAEYQAWAERVGLPTKDILGSRHFYTCLARRFNKVKRSIGSHYQGVGLKR